MDVKHTKVKNLTDAGNSGLFTDGDWVESKDQDPQGEIRLIQLADVGINKFKDKSNRYLTKSKASELNCTYLKKGDLLISRLPDPLGRTCMFPLDGDRKYVTVVDVSILRVDEEAYNSKYVEYILNAPQTRQKVQSKQTGTTRKRISRKNLAEIEIPTPPLPTQHRIVEKMEELFSELDNGVENLKKAQQQLKIYRQAVLKDAFEGKLTKEWREQQDNLPTPEELLQQIKTERKAHRQRKLANWEKEVEQWEKDGKPGRKPTKPRKVKKLPAIKVKEFSTVIPNSWVRVRLGEVVDLINGDRGKNYPNKSEYVSQGVAWINTGHIEPDGTLTSTDMNYITEEKFNSLRSGKIEKGDMVYCLRGATFGKTAFVKPYSKGAIASSLVIIRALIKSMRRYIYYFLISPSGRNQLFQYDNGSAQPNLSATSVSKYILPYPAVKEQIEIVNEIESRLSVVDQLEETIKENLRKAEALRQSILKKAFDGKLIQ